MYIYISYYDKICWQQLVGKNRLQVLSGIAGVLLVSWSSLNCVSLVVGVLVALGVSVVF